MAKVILPGFFKGMVDKKASAKLDDGYNEKASDLVNFYNDNSTVITRRPPLEEWIDVGISEESLNGASDFVQLPNDADKIVLISKVDDLLRQFLGGTFNNFTFNFFDRRSEDDISVRLTTINSVTESGDDLIYDITYAPRPSFPSNNRKLHHYY